MGGATGLRERKKRRTRERILACARDLFDAKGFAETTIPEIAAAADVSPRTVSSYFPHKEELVFPATDEMLGDLSEALAARAAGELATDALRDWLIRSFVEVDPAAQPHHKHPHGWARELIASDPDLRAHERMLQQRAEGLVAAAVAVDLALPPDHHLPHMVAATAMAALDSLGRETGVEADPTRSRRLIDDAMKFVAAGVRELQTD